MDVKKAARPETVESRESELSALNSAAYSLQVSFFNMIVRYMSRCNELARKAIKHYGIFLESYQPVPGCVCR